MSLSLFFPPAWFPFGLFQFHPLLLTGKVKQEPSVYRDGPPYQRRGSLQLWQFLVTLLDDPANGHFIAWTGRGMEFKLIEPEEVSPRLCAALLTSFVTFVIYSLCLLSSVGGSSLGHPKEQTCHELRQAEPLTALLL